MTIVRSLMLAALSAALLAGCDSKTSAVASAPRTPPPPAPPATVVEEPVAMPKQAPAAATAATTVFNHEQATLDGLKAIPEADIQRAKRELKIAYGHTSHGSQIPGGMAPLDAFMGGRGLYTVNGNGEGGALHLQSGAGYDENAGMCLDAGYELRDGTLRFEEETSKFLGAPDAQGRGSRHPEINVVMWSFCGQMSGFEPDRQVRWYLDGMKRLDQAYPGVTFIRMTGHLDGSGVDGRLNQNNELVRADCRQHGHWLFDFADIESYDPDGNEYLSRGGTDECGYEGGNWAVEWQDKHQEGRDWYQCDCAHSQPLNGNRKAYAAWAMFAALARARAGA